MSPDPYILEKFAQIRCIVTDVDGVLSNGQITYHEKNAESKSFNIQDGVGFNLARLATIKTAVITGRDAQATARRIDECHVDYYFARIENKAGCLLQIAGAENLDKSQICYIGDDLNDLTVQPYVGVFIAPNDAHPRVRDTADWVTNKAGGQGCFRELVDTILTAQNRLREIEDRYLTTLCHS